MNLTISFLKNPLKEREQVSARSISNLFLRYFLFLYAVKIVCQFLIVSAFGIERPRGPEPEGYMIYLLIALPFLEELAFRLPLILERKYFQVSGILLAFFSTALCVRFYEFQISMAVSVGIVPWFFMMLFSYTFKNTQMTRVIVFYSYSSLFAIVHFWNSPDLPFFAYLFVFIPHFASAVIYGFLRLRLSFWHGVLFHYIINLLPFVAFLIKMKNL